MLKWLFLMIVCIVLTFLILPLSVFVRSLMLIFNKQHKVSFLFEKVALSLDQLGGAIIYLDEDTTISSNTYKYAHIKNNRYALYFESFIDLLFYKGHCKDSYESEVLKKDKN